jgi:hypothetical protein
LGVDAPITIYIDADACPVKQEIYRVAERHALKGTALKVLVVTNSPITVPRDIFVGGRPDAKPGSTFAGRPLIERVVVGAGMDEADNWIAERAYYKPKLTSIPLWGTLAYARPSGIGDRTRRLPAAGRRTAHRR